MLFNDVGTRVQREVAVKQYRRNPGKLHCVYDLCSLYIRTDNADSIDRVTFGVIDPMNGQFSYFGNETNMTLYPGMLKEYLEVYVYTAIPHSLSDGIPSDGTPINTTVTYHLALVITYDILAILGIIFATVCLVFNFAFRKRRYERTVAVIIFTFNLSTGLFD